MFASILVIAAVGALLYFVKRWQSLPESERASFARKALIYGGAAVVLGLVVAGKAHWLMGVLAALMALASRAMQLAQYAPLIKKLMGEESPSGSDESAVAARENMSRQQAADILGVDVDDSRDDVKLAHKRLIQKLHPDRGGSDALAKQINLAKDVLLS